MLGERTSLLERGERDYGSSTETYPQGTVVETLDLVPHSQAVLDWAQRRRRGQNSRFPAEITHGFRLTVLLHVRYLNGRLVAGLKKSKEATRQRVSRGRKLEQEREIIDDGIYDCLDAGLKAVLPGGEGLDGLPEDAADGLDEETEEAVESLLWTKWTFGHTCLSAIDLLLPPYTPSPPPFLSHPLLVHSLEHTWSHGLPPPQTYSTAGNIIGQLKSYITPRRSHVLLLTWHLLLLALSVSMAIRPIGWIRPLEDDQRLGISVVEALYAVLAISSFINTLSTPLSALLLLPSLLIPLVTLVDPSSAFSLLAFSLLPLTLLLVLPTTPCLAFLRPEPLLPLSSLLLDILSRGIRSAGLILPLALLVFAVFSWSLNGDIFRGFFVHPSFPITPRDSTQGSTHTMADSPVDVEVGIAPYETRLWIFITLLTLLLLSACLMIVRLVTPPRDIVPISRHTPGCRRTSYPHNMPPGGLTDMDPWTVTCGPTLALASRQRWAATSHCLLDKRKFPPPLNVLVLPLQLFLAAYHALPVSWRTERIRSSVATVERIEDDVWAITMGSMCFPLYLLDRLVGICT